MSNSSDSDSDSELESLVDLAFSKVKAKFQSTVTTTTSSMTTRSRSKKNELIHRLRIPKQTATSDTKGISESNNCNSASNDLNKQSNYSFFVDKNPGKLVDLEKNDFDSFVQGTVDKTSSSPVILEGNTESENSDSDDDDGLQRTSADTSKELAGIDGSPKIHKQMKRSELSSSLQSGIDTSDIYVNVKSYSEPKIHQPQIDSLLLGAQNQILKKSVITADFEKQDTVLPYAESLNKLRQQRRRERSMTKGKNWYNLPATELTEERKNDLKVLQMRHALDPKRFYRANDTRAAPKYFQFGTVVESKADFFSSRIPKKQRKSTLVEELLADADFRSYNKRKYAEIQEAKRTGSGPYQKTRFPKKRKKNKN